MQLIPSGSSIFHKHRNRLCVSPEQCPSASVTSKFPIIVSSARVLWDKQQKTHAGLRGWKGTWVTGLAQMRMRVLEKVLEEGTAPLALPRTNSGMILFQLPLPPPPPGWPSTGDPVLWEEGVTDSHKMTNSLLLSEQIDQWEKATTKSPKALSAPLARGKGLSRCHMGRQEVSPSEETMGWEEQITRWLTPKRHVSTVTPCFGGCWRLHLVLLPWK